MFETIPDGLETIARPKTVEAPAISPAMQKQVAAAVACCGKVARLYRRYGGTASFVPAKASGSARIPGAPVKAPRSGYAIKRTIKGLK